MDTPVRPVGMRFKSANLGLEQLRTRYPYLTERFNQACANPKRSPLRGQRNAKAPIPAKVVISFDAETVK
jgi:hypothetical protein